MALTLTKTVDFVAGDRRVWIGTVAFDASYPTGGEAIAYTDFGFDVTLNTVLVGSQSSLVPTKVVSYDPSTGKLVINVEDGTSGISAEAGNASDQSGVVDVVVVAIGQ